MSNTATKKVPYSYKIAFGIGMLANQMFPAVLGIFMVVLVQDLGFPGWMWGVLFFLPRVFDSFTDPIMGFISDNTKSKWGRRRQYVFVGAILMGISFMIMWQLYEQNGVTYNFTYFLGWSVAFFLGLTIFSVPYVAMGYEMSDDFHERTQIMAIAQWIGQWAWVIAPWFWVIMYDQGGLHQQVSDLGIDWLAGILPAEGWFATAEIGVRTSAIWVGAIFMICAMVPALVIKSESTVDKDYSKLTFSNIGNSVTEILKSFKEAFQSVPFRKLCIATFFIFNAFNTVAAFTFFVIVYHLFGGDSAAAGIWPTLFGCLGALVTTFVVIPIVAKMSKMMGKKRAFMWSQGISIIGYILLWFLLIPGKPYMFIFALPFFSFGIGSLFTLMMSMTADVIDLDELVNGDRREGVFGAIYWWMVKFGFAIAGGLSGVIISLVGFNPDAVVAPGEVWPGITGLRVFFSGLPIVGTLIAMYAMHDYDIDEEKANEIREILEKRKAKPEEHEQVLTSYYEIGKVDTFDSVTVKNPYLPLYMDLEKDDLKTVFQEQLDYKVNGICFSPYAEGQTIGDELTKEQIQNRIEIIKPFTNSVRSFSCTDGNELIPQLAHPEGLETIVGAWLSSDLDKNEEEIKALIKLGKEGVVDIAAVGNEALMRGELSEEQIIDYLKRVKKELPHVPVTYVDAYYQFLDKPALIEHCDIILINCYPFWEGYSIDESIHVIQKMYALVQERSEGKKVLISETGWPTSGTKNGSAEPSLTNMMKYFTNLYTWSSSNEVEIFYFSSFDESWKFKYEGEAGTSWGIWNSNNELKIKE